MQADTTGHNRTLTRHSSSTNRGIHAYPPVERGFRMRFRFEDFEFSSQQGRLYFREKAIRARPKLIELFRYLIDRRNQVVTREELLKHLWPDVKVGQTSLSTLLNEARHLLGDSGDEQRIIRTESGRGYSFVAAVEIRREDRHETGEGELHRALQSILKAGKSAIQDGDLSTAQRCLESALRMTRHPSGQPSALTPIGD